MSTKVITKTTRPSKAERRSTRLDRVLDQAQDCFGRLRARNDPTLSSPTSPESTSTDRTITETPIQPNLEDLQAAAILMSMRGEIAYTPTDWTAITAEIQMRAGNVTQNPHLNTPKLSFSTSPGSASTDRTIPATEIPIQPNLEDLEAAAILMSMRGESDYSLAEWNAAIALIKLSMDEVVHNASSARTIPAIAASPVSAESDTSSVTFGRRSPSPARTISLGDESPVSADGDASVVTPERRVTRTMGVRRTPMAAYDMSYHPLDDVIRVRARARNGRKPV